MKIIGTCSECGGPVGYPEAWYGLIPPRPTCSQCGAVAEPAFGPVIKMTPQRQDRPPVDVINNLAPRSPR